MGGGGGKGKGREEEQLTHPESALLSFPPPPHSSRTECEDLTLSISLLTGLITVALCKITANNGAPGPHQQD